MLVSFYPHSLKPKASQALELAEVLAGIRDGRWSAEVEAVRAAAADSKAYAAAKKVLPGFTVSGTFAHRKAEHLAQHSGFLCLDIDAKANPGADLVAARQAVEADSYTYACFMSVGGAGWAAVVPIPPNDHKSSFRALAAYYLSAYGLVVDPSCKDASRLRFISYDPALYLNEAAATFEETLAEAAGQPARLAPAAALAAPDLRSADTEATLIAIGVKMIRQATDGGKHHAVRNAAHTVGGYVGSGFVDASKAYEALLAEVLAKENVADLKTAEKALRSGLYVTGPTKPLLPEWLQLKVRRELRETVQAYGTVVTLAQGIATRAHVPLAGVQAAVEAIAEEQKASATLLTFWHLVDGGKRDAPPKLVLSPDMYLAWLAREGFRKYRTGEASYLTVRVTANIVHRQDSGQVRDFVNAYLASLPYEFDGVYHFQLKDLVRGQDTKYFDARFLQNLPSLEQPFLRDTRELAYFFFSNCWVRISADERRASPYDELPGLIWAEQVRTHALVLISQDAAEQCDFHPFTANVSGREPARLALLQNALGYMLHGYKEELSARCVIFLDEVATTGKPDGRTGKSLLIKAVGELVKVILIPGATFRFEDAFRFSRVDLDTRLLYFDEWDGRRLPFKKLFTEITTELAVNKKNAPEFVIPFADSPKFAMTTNDVILGDGSSHEGRKLEIPLAPHYSAHHTPKDEFGVGFFKEGWDVAEYNRFFNLALFWVQGFLASGRQLQQLPSATLAARKLEQETSPEFMEFAAELAAHGLNETEPEIWAADAFGRYQTETGDRRATAQRFNGWLVKLGFTKAKCYARGHRYNQIYFIKPNGTASKFSESNLEAA
ncbi:hypothetical protein GCM10027422_28610 [Hymenobacter arcticus]